MARGADSVKNLAVEAGIGEDEAILILIEAGFEVSAPRDKIWSRDIKKARNLLGIPRWPRSERLAEIADLARRCGRPETEVRDSLVQARVVGKRRLKRVPTHLLERAEEILGLRTPPAPTSTSLHVIPRDLRPSEILSPKPRKTDDWPIIGPVQDLVFLTPTDVADLHFVLVRDFAKTKDPIDPPGVRDWSLLESAVYRPRTALGADDKYPTVAMAAAALLHAIVLDHPFHNGNKRTALVSVLAFLDKNGWVLTSDQDKAYEFLLQLADHKLTERHSGAVLGADPEVAHSARWLQARIRKVIVREHPLQFRQLRAILQSYGCSFEHARGEGNRVNFRRGALQTQVAYRNDGADVQKNTIHKIRKDLQLDEEHGFDSDIFYNQGPRIPEFINKYRKLLSRLAKV